MRKLAAIILLFTASCVGVYQPVSFNTIEYKTAYQEQDLTIKIDYGNDSLGFKKFDKRINKKNIRLIELLVTNEGSKSADISEPTVSINGNNIELLENEELYNALKYCSGCQSLYALIGPWYISSTPPNFVYIPVGLALGIVNYIKARKNNRKLQSFIEELQLPTEPLEPGDTAQILIAFMSESKVEEVFIEFSD